MVSTPSRQNDSLIDLLITVIEGAVTSSLETSGSCSSTNEVGNELLLVGADILSDGDGRSLAVVGLQGRFLRMLFIPAGGTKLDCSHPSI